MKIWWSKISLSLLFIVAFIGTSLRGLFLFELPFKYSNLVHAHSHIAFQGWVYTLVFLLITNLFLREEQIKRGRYLLQFKLTLFIVVGILVSFTVQGYGLYSIIFSSLFQVVNFWFIFKFLKDSKKSEDFVKQSISLRFVNTGLWLGLFSNVLPWGVGVLSAKGLNGTEMYQSLIYAFLHFQYNGWFLFIVIGLFFKLFEKEGVLFKKDYAIKFYWLFTIAVIPALSLSFLGMSFREYIIAPAYISGLLQIVGAGFFFLILKNVLLSWMHKKSIWFQLLISAFLVSFFLKVILQFLSAFPVFEVYAFNNKNIILAFLHLSLIGVITIYLLAILIQLKWIVINWFSKTGIILFLLGFVITELVLSLGGVELFYNHKVLFFGSAFMALGALLLVLSSRSYSLK